MCWSTGIFTHRVYREGFKKETSSEGQLSAWKRLVDGRGQKNGQTGSSWWKGNSYSNNQLLKPMYAEEHLNAQHIKSWSRWASSWRPHRVPLLSAKNRKLGLQWAQVHQIWTIEDSKNVAWSDESRFLLWNSNGGSEFGVSIIKAWILVSTIQTGGGMDGVGDIFLAQFGPLSTSWASFKCYSLPEYYCSPYPSLYDHSVTIF